MAKKIKYKARSFESRGETEQNGKKIADTSANVYDSMMKSEAFKDLKSRQKVLYLVCKQQFYGKRKPGADFPDMAELQGTDLFYISWQNVLEYGIYTKNMSATFYADLKALQEHGFIEQVSKGGGYSKQKSIWKYSAKWQEWNKTA